MQTQIAGLEPTTVHLRMDFALARSWADLESLCERLDAAYRRGDLDLVAAEELSVLAAVTAAGIPEESSISAAALLDRGVCDCCGSTIRRGAVCAICHPLPALQLDNRQAA